MLRERLQVANRLALWTRSAPLPPNDKKYEDCHGTQSDECD
jgi:hypothetical protein